jgi:hypothetical protein
MRDAPETKMGKDKLGCNFPLGTKAHNTVAPEMTDHLQHLAHFTYLKSHN